MVGRTIAPLLVVIGLAGCGDDSSTVVGGSGSGGAPAGSSSAGDPTSSSGAAPTTPSTTSGDAGSTSVAMTTAPDGSTSSGSTGDLACNSVCGNGQLDCNEECDCGDGIDCTAEALGFVMCVDLDNVFHPEHPFTGGVLGCNLASCRFDTAACEWGCGDGIVSDGEACDPKVEAPSCADLGRGTGTDPLPCNGRCELDASTCQMTRERR